MDGWMDRALKPYFRGSRWNILNNYPNPNTIDFDIDLCCSGNYTAQPKEKKKVATKKEGHTL